MDGLFVQMKEIDVPILYLQGLLDVILKLLVQRVPGIDRNE